MINFFAKHPTAANLLMIMLTALGLMSLPNLKRETFPNFIDPVVVVRTIYPGATTLEVEDAICRRIEDAAEEIAFVEEITSSARESVSTVTVEMVDGADFQKFLSDIKTAVEAIDDFPELVEKPLINSSGDTQQVVSLAVAGDMSATDLKNYCELLRERLLRRDDISLVTLQGFSKRQIRIEVPADRLIELGMSPADLADVVSRQSLDMPSGTLETDAANVVVRLMEERRNPLDFEDLVIAGNRAGTEVRLGDIAQISDRFDLDEDKIIFNGKRAGMLRIEKTTNQDALTIYDSVAAFVLEEKERAPKGVSLSLTRDLTSITKDRLSMLLKNAWQGLLLVFFTLWLFLNVRLSFWVTLGLPVSFLGAFFALPALGMSINMITMVGLLLALGLLMDDAIVIAENVATHLAKGENALKSVVAGVSEVKVGVLSSFLTTLVVFGPLTMLSGNIGKILGVLPVVLIAVLAVSLIEAFLILPNHLAHSHVDGGPKGFRRRFDQAVETFKEKVLGGLVDWSIRNRYFSLGLVFLTLMVSISMLAGGVLKFQAFPSIDGDVIEARLQLQQGTPLASTEALVSHLVTTLKEIDEEKTPDQPDGRHLVTNINVQFSTNTDAGVSGTHVATVSVDLLSADIRVGTINEIKKRWREKIGRTPDIVSLTFTEPSIGPAGNPLEYRLYGDDWGKLDEAAVLTKAWLGQFPGVNDLQDDLQPGKPEVRVRIRQGAFGQGINAGMVANQLRGAYLGITAREIQVGSESYEVDVRLASLDRDSLADLEYFHITLPNGDSAPLGTIAELDTDARGYSRLKRYNGRGAVTIWGDVDSDKTNVKELNALFLAEFVPDLKERYPGLEIGVEGESAEAGETAGSMKRAMSFGLLGVFILLSFQFRGYLEPLIVMAAIPLSLIGVIWGHLLLGYPLTMPSMVGFISLMGVVVNDSILLVTFIDNRVAGGATVMEAARGASRDRFRAVLLTSLTTIAGLLPLLTERSLQAQIMIPLAISLIFGLLASTVLVLIVIPTLFALFIKERPARAAEISEH